jgi:hypothetical protein
MRRRKFYFVLIVMITSALMTVPASATALLYTDRVAWEAATSGLFTIDFEGLATPGVPSNHSTAGGLTIGGVQFIGLTPPSSYYLYGQDPATSPNFSWNSGDVLIGPNAAWGGGYIEVNLPAGGVTSVGTDLMTHTPFAQPVVVSLSTGESFTVGTYGNPTRAFVGFTSDVPLTSIRFTPENGYSIIDNFSDGSAPGAEVSEANPLVLGATGLLSLWIARRLRRRVCK